MNTFKKYVAESKVEYKYLLKFAIPQMSDEMIDLLEAGLVKYKIKEASAFRKTPIQESPLDFPNVRNMPVFICDLTLEYPASLDFLRTYICNLLSISPQVVAVYSENDPRQIETDLYNYRTSQEFKDEYVTRLGSDHESVEGADEQRYGEEYNTNFLKELEKVRKERELVTVTNSLSQNPERDNSDLSKDYHGFNSDKQVDKHQIGFFGRIKRPNIVGVK